ncbi:hypothetical protein HNQ87_000115 [Pacificimonas flava]|nr:hypothetical protein [Pacificimonas flava]
MAAAIMGDDADALVQNDQHLIVPVVRRQRPAMMEDDRLRGPVASILVENFGTVLRGDVAHGHWSF